MLSQFTNLEVEGGYQGALRSLDSPHLHQESLGLTPAITPTTLDLPDLRPGQVQPTTGTVGASGELRVELTGWFKGWKERSLDEQYHLGKELYDLLPTEVHDSVDEM